MCLASLALLGACAHTASNHRPVVIARELPDHTVAPRLLHAVEPEYPDALRREGREAIVRVGCLIGEDGRIKDVGVLRPDADSSFAPHAVEAVRQWKFAPAMRDGKPIAMQIMVPIRFAFPDSGERKTYLADAR